MSATLSTKKVSHDSIVNYRMILIKCHTKTVTVKINKRETENVNDDEIDKIRGKTRGQAP